MREDGNWAVVLQIVPTDREFILSHRFASSDEAEHYTKISSGRRSHGVPITFITPPAWKRAVGLTLKSKDAARSEAIRRWPDQPMPVEEFVSRNREAFV